MRYRLSIEGDLTTSAAAEKLRASFQSFAPLIQQQRTAIFNVTVSSEKKSQVQGMLERAAKAVLTPAFFISSNPVDTDANVTVDYRSGITLTPETFADYLHAFAQFRSHNWTKVNKLLDDASAEDYLSLVENRETILSPGVNIRKYQGGILGETFLHSILRGVSRQIPGSFQLADREAGEPFPLKNPQDQSLHFFTRHNCSPMWKALAPTVELDALAMINGRESYVFDATLSPARITGKDVPLLRTRLNNFLRPKPKVLHVAFADYRGYTTKEDVQSTVVLFPIRFAINSILRKLRPVSRNRHRDHYRDVVDDILHEPLAPPERTRLA